MPRSPRVTGYLYFFFGVSLVFFAIHQTNRTGEWDFFTILFMAVAAIDFMIAFRYFSLASKLKNSEDKKK
ncbi:MULTISPECIES: YdiK family protein [Bacillaceae]|uniref:YdiK family protein n=1 Tax=Evansella alkalicola TaxID=745819 RepID=A0ABS6JYJ6_9BACI|nr:MULTISPECIES: YdiK family protein [Bacillaceae]MBU9723669.1 YdiK family protein [Bacillus alkalicola]